MPHTGPRENVACSPVDAAGAAPNRASPLRRSSCEETDRRPIKQSAFRGKNPGALVPKGTALRKSRFTETQIVGISKESEAGANMKDLRLKHGVSPNTFYKWKAKYGGLEVGDVAKLRGLENEKRRLKRTAGASRR